MDNITRTSSLNTRAASEFGDDAQQVARLRARILSVLLECNSDTAHKLYSKVIQPAGLSIVQLHLEAMVEAFHRAGNQQILDAIIIDAGLQQNSAMLRTFSIADRANGNINTDYNDAAKDVARIKSEKTSLSYGKTPDASSKEIITESKYWFTMNLDTVNTLRTLLRVSPGSVSPLVASSITDAKVLPDGIALTTIVSSVSGISQGVRDRVNGHIDDVMVWCDKYTQQINMRLGELLATGTTTFQNGETFTKTDTGNPEYDEYSNTAQLLGPTVRYMIDGAPCLGFIDTYGTNRYYNGSSSGFRFDVITGIAGAVLSTVPQTVTDKVLSIVEKAGELLRNRNIREGSRVGYAVMMPLFDYTPELDRINASLMLFKVSMTYDHYIQVRTCSSSESVQMQYGLSLQHYRINLRALNEIIGGNTALIEQGRQFFGTNKQASKATEADAPGAPPKPTPGW